MPDWPDNVPLNFVRDQYRESGPANAVLRDPVDRGPPKARLRFTGAVRPVSIALRPLTRAQVIAFEAWFEDTIAYGALTFSMQHPRTGLPANYQFNSPATPYAIVELAEDVWELSFTLDQMP